MKLKNAYFYTLREDARDEDSASGNLLVKAGYIKKTSAGVYMMLPLGLRVQNNIENIIRKHMDAAGAQEVKMPALIASEYYEKSGRMKGFGPSIFKLKDRNNKDFVLGPTHEELFAYAAKSKIRSYKDMPFNIYQFQTKYRDEPRARFGLIRVKEFVMKDAYSFDADEAGLNESYKKMFEAYKASFDEIGIDYRIVKADTGIMGGLLSEEFQAITPIGEDKIAYCDHCGYTSNTEISECIYNDSPSTLELLAIEEVYTPNAGTIKEVCDYLAKEEKDFVKTIIYTFDGQPYAVMVRGDREISEAKLSKLISCSIIELADSKTVEEVTGAKVGFAGPIGIKCPIILDKEVAMMSNYITGANKTDYHYLNVNNGDFTPAMVADVRLICEGDVCPVCGKPLSFTKGIEVGNTFKLGTKYSDALDLKYLNSANKEEPVWMGSYGIGLGRTMAALVEQSHDDKGIIWPVNIAPYKAIILIMVTKDQLQCEMGDKLYTQLNEAGISAILDDRNERPGIKFNDADLIGIPFRITVGKKIAEGIVEVKKRWEDEAVEVSVDKLVDYLKESF